MKQLIIIRGLPGTGTFELGRTLQNAADNVVHCSPSQYFDKPDDGVPNPRLYHPLLAPMAARWCREMVAESLDVYNDATVIVSDVFLSRDDVNAYRALGKDHGAVVTVLQTVDNGVTETADVPAAVMHDLRDMWEPV